MKLIRCLVFGLAAALLTLLGAAEAQTVKDKAKGGAPTTSADLFTAPLIPAEVLAKLKLSAEQKPQVDALVKQFDAKLKEIAKNTASTTPPPPPPKAKGKGGVAQASPQVVAVLTLQAECEKKLEELLTLDQRKLLDELRAKMAPGLK